MSHQIRILRNSFRIAIVVLALITASCGGPADNKLVTGTDIDSYRASLDPIFEQMSPHEREAFNWAVSDINFENLHAKYPNASPRKIIRGEVKAVLDTYPERINRLKTNSSKFVDIRNELSKVSVTYADLSHSNEFVFRGKPILTMGIENESTLPISSLDWNASLFLDGSDKPVATQRVTADMREAGGMKPGDSFKVTIRIGGPLGNDSWETLEIKNSKNKKVVLTPILPSIRDFGNRLYLDGDPTDDIARLELALKSAVSYKDI